MMRAAGRTRPPPARTTTMTSVLFGSISTVADTSELQRQAFNDAFAEHGLGWTWERAEYRRMLAAEADAGKRAHGELKSAQARLQQSEDKVESLEGQMEALQVRTAACSLLVARTPRLCLSATTSSLWSSAPHARCGLQHRPACGMLVSARKHARYSAVQRACWEADL